MNIHPISKENILNCCQNLGPESCKNFILYILTHIEQTQKILDTIDSNGGQALRNTKENISHFLEDCNHVKKIDTTILNNITRLLQHHHETLVQLKESFPAHLQEEIITYLNILDDFLTNSEMEIDLEVIDKMINENYNPDKRGMCAGIVMMMILISLYTDDEFKFARIWLYVLSKNIPSEAKDKFDEYIHPLFDGITLGMDMYGNCPELKIISTGRQDIENTANILGYNQKNEKKLIKKSFVTKIHPDEVKDFENSPFAKFITRMKNLNPNTSFSIMNGFKGHLTALKVEKSGRYSAINHNKYIYTNSLEKAFYVAIGSELHKTKTDQPIPFSLDMISVGTNLIADPNQIEELGTIPEISKENFPLIKKMLNLAMREGQTEIVTAYMEKIINSNKVTDKQKKNLLKAKDADGASGLYMAMQNNQIETVSNFIDIILNSNLDNKLKYKVLMGRKDEKETPGLWMAMQKGHTELVKMFIDKIMDSKKLDTRLKKWLMSSISFYGPALYIAAQEGHTEIVEFFIRKVMESTEFDPGQKLELVAGKYRDPALYIAMHLGHTKIVKACIDEFIASKEFNNDQKKDLLAAKTRYGIPGLTAAIHEGHIETVVEVIRTILDSELDDAIQQEVVLAKLNHLPALFEAITSGQTETVKKVVQTILKSRAKNSVKKEILAPAGITHLAIALAREQEKIVYEFTLAIIESDLDDDLKKEILEARCGQGKTGFSEVKRVGKQKAVGKFIQAFIDSSLDESKKKEWLKPEIIKDYCEWAMKQPASEVEIHDLAIKARSLL